MARAVPRAAIAAVVWQLVQIVGGYLVARTLKNSTAVYGVFGLVIGLLSWLYLQAQLTLYAAEIDVVKHRKLWPRALVPPPLTEADERAYRAYAEVEERRRPQHVALRVNEASHRHPSHLSDPTRRGDFAARQLCQ